ETASIGRRLLLENESALFLELSLVDLALAKRQFRIAMASEVVSRTSGSSRPRARRQTGAHQHVRSSPAEGNGPTHPAMLAGSTRCPSCPIRFKGCWTTAVILADAGCPLLNRNTVSGAVSLWTLGGAKPASYAAPPKSHNAVAVALRR